MSHPMMRPVLLWTVAASLMVGCASHRPSPQNTQIYHAPAQAYSINLGSQAFRGDVTLRDSCSSLGSTLDVTDSTGRFFRVEVINLLNNPNIQIPEFSDERTIQELVLNDYLSRVHKSAKLVEQRPVRSRLGNSLYAVLEVNSFQRTDYVGYVVARRGNFAYVTQHIQNSYRPTDMRDVLAVLASEIKIPSMTPPAYPRERTDLPLFIDLKNSTIEQITEWQKVARCT